MPLVVEDGTGLANAESYISVADADARHAAFGNSAWSGDNAAKEAALRRATAYIEQTYRGRWTGRRMTSVQALSWPRYDVVADGFLVPSSVVPDDVANAVADLAARALTSDLAPDQTRGLIRKKIGPIEKEWDRNSPQATRYTAVSGLLAPYLTRGGTFAQVVRT